MRRLHKIHFHLPLILLMALLSALSLAACQNDDNTVIPTPRPLVPTVVDTNTPNPSDTPGGPTRIPSATFPPTVTATATQTDTPPPPPPTETPVPGPYEHRINQGDDCISIVRQYGHRELDVLQVFYNINDIQGGRCILPPAGEVVFVPRPTAIMRLDDSGTPILSPTPPIQPLVGDSFISIGEICAGEGDDLFGLALRSNTRPQRLCELNPPPEGLDCSGCVFEADSWLGTCPRAPIIRVGQCFSIPAATPSPTGTAPPSGLESPTPTPTHRAPQIIYPPDGAIHSGILRLQWASVGFLQSGQYYVVSLIDETNGAQFFTNTTQTFLDVPLEYVPADGQAHNISWYIAVQSLDENGLFQPIGGRSPDYRFTWE